VYADVAKLQLFVYGAGGHAKIVIETIKRQGAYNLVGLLDDDPGKKGRELLGVQVLGGQEKLGELQAAGVGYFVVAIGNNRARRQKMGELLRLGLKPVTVIDPTAIVLGGASVGAGSMILGYSCVSADVTLGQACILSINCSVGHDSCLGDCAHLAPGVRLGGNVHIGEESFLGLGAVVLPGVHIGQRVTVGAGAAVVRDLPDDTVAVGVPAKIMRRNAREG